MLKISFAISLSAFAFSACSLFKAEQKEASASRQGSSYPATTTAIIGEIEAALKTTSLWGFELATSTDEMAGIKKRIGNELLARGLDRSEDLNQVLPAIVDGVAYGIGESNNSAAVKSARLATAITQATGPSSKGREALFPHGKAQMLGVAAANSYHLLAKAGVKPADRADAMAAVTEGLFHGVNKAGLSQDELTSVPGNVAKEIISSVSSVETAQAEALIEKSSAQVAKSTATLSFDNDSRRGAAIGLVVRDMMAGLGESAPSASVASFAGKVGRKIIAGLGDTVQPASLAGLAATVAEEATKGFSKIPSIDATNLGQTTQGFTEAMIAGLSDIKTAVGLDPTAIADTVAAMSQGTVKGATAFPNLSPTGTIDLLRNVSKGVVTAAGAINRAGYDATHFATTAGRAVSGLTKGIGYINVVGFSSSTAASAASSLIEGANEGLAGITFAGFKDRLASASSEITKQLLGTVDDLASGAHVRITSADLSGIVSAVTQKALSEGEKLASRLGVDKTAILQAATSGATSGLSDIVMTGYDATMAESLKTTSITTAITGSSTDSTLVATLSATVTSTQTTIVSADSFDAASATETTCTAAPNYRWYGGKCWSEQSLSILMGTTSTTLSH